MSDREKVLTVVREWVWKAENDLQSAAHAVELGEMAPRRRHQF